MYRSLITLVLAAPCIAMSSVPPRVPAAAVRSPDAVAAPGMGMQHGTPSMKVSSAHRQTAARTSLQSPGSTAANKPVDNESGGGTYGGTLLATLALMGAIALRRHKPGP